MRLPAALAKVVLAGAMQDFIDEVRPTDDADWLTLVRAARAVDARADRGLHRRRDRGRPARARHGPPRPGASDDRRVAAALVARARGAAPALDARRVGRRRRPTRRSSRFSSPGDDAYVSGPTLLRAQRRSAGRGDRRDVLRRRPPGVRADRAAVRVRVGRRRGDRRAPGARRRPRSRAAAASCRRCGPSRSATPSASTSTSCR